MLPRAPCPFSVGLTLAVTLGTCLLHGFEGGQSEQIAEKPPNFDICQKDIRLDFSELFYFFYVSVFPLIKYIFLVPDFDCLLVSAAGTWVTYYSILVTR